MRCLSSKRNPPIHLNVNSLLPKIVKTRCTAACTNAAVTGKSESKLDETVRNPNI